jgi:hypothetical protein
VAFPFEGAGSGTVGTVFEIEFHGRGENRNPARRTSVVRVMPRPA